MTIIEQRLGIDPRDKTILEIIGANPSISQSEIGKKINLSQPSVGARIQKLKDKGLLQVVSGINFKKVGLFLAKVDIQATDTDEVIQSFDHCPFFINGFVVSGTDNLCIFLTAPTIEAVEEVVNYHLRSHPHVKNVRMDLVIKPINDFVMPISFDTSSCSAKKVFKERCGTCPVREKVFV